jgi:hypothetical protein
MGKLKKEEDILLEKVAPVRLDEVDQKKTTRHDRGWTVVADEKPSTKTTKEMPSHFGWLMSCVIDYFSFPRKERYKEGKCGESRTHRLLLIIFAL